MFNRFNKNKEDEKWSNLLSGTWEIELPVSQFLNATNKEKTSTNEQKSENNHINDPNSVSNRQCPMIQIAKDLKIISLPLSTDIANPQIHQKYLESISICTNSTRLKVEEKDQIKLILDNNNHQNKNENNDKDKEDENSINVILKGTISLNNIPHSIRWSDGALWSKQGMELNKNENNESIEEPSLSANDHPSNNNHSAEISSLHSQIEILREKEKMAKAQSQAMMGQFADLSQNYAKLTTEHENLSKKYTDLDKKHNEMSKEYTTMKEELNKVRGDMVFSKQQEIQTKLTKLTSENEEYAKSIKLQQERILSLQDQLQSSHIATRQYTKTIEDLEAKIHSSSKERMEAKAVLTEINNKFVTSQTQLDDERHRILVITEKHKKEIMHLCDKHHAEIDKLERGFQETLSRNENKMQELETLRNNYEKKNASLSKDVKKLIKTLEKQNGSYSKFDNQNGKEFVDVNVEKLKHENAKLSEELIRKSQSLMDALNALENGKDQKVKSQKELLAELSHINHHKNGSLNVNKQQSSPQSLSPSMNKSKIVIGAQYGINDAVPSMNKIKFNRFKDRFGNKMKAQMYKFQQNMVKSEIEKHKDPKSPNLNELNAKNAIKESEKVIITKTKQQLNTQCAELQGIANELSSTIEQKEVILESLRFANTYLGKRVIALEKLMEMKPGKEIKNQEELIKNALSFTNEENGKDDDDDDGYEVKEFTEDKDKNEQIAEQKKISHDEQQNEDESNEVLKDEKENAVDVDLGDKGNPNEDNKESDDTIKDDEEDSEKVLDIENSPNEEELDQNEINDEQMKEEIVNDEDDDN